MLGMPWKTRWKRFSSATFSSFEPGSVMATKCRPASSPPRALRRLGEEIVHQHVGLERRARLARYDEQRARQIDLVLEALHLLRIGGIEHVQLGKSRRRAEALRQHLGAEARAAHAEKQHVAVSLARAPRRRIPSSAAGRATARRRRRASRANRLRRRRSTATHPRSTAGGYCLALRQASAALPTSF